MIAVGGADHEITRDDIARYRRSATLAKYQPIVKF